MISDLNEKVDIILAIQHTGVKGMKWGVRRSTKNLQNQITKLQNKNVKYNDNIKTKLNPSIAKLNAKAAKQYSKARKKEQQYVKAELRAGNKHQEKQAKKIKFKAGKYYIKGDKLKNKAHGQTRKVAKLQKKTQENIKRIARYNNGIKRVNSGNMQYGKNVLTKHFMKY